ncbi:hypothetical protein DFH08DRAFT_816062 [Mycena albidolilacea]|uniref:Uncharacterized protein n=1 Tax=Mycena albidolilacea TaxID=1033008 RepID=A0AAD7EIX6_9AGAR|nr:hypothetical protein DFH08DRAFT_816062 [Mycena albidolilacea]
MVLVRSSGRIRNALWRATRERNEVVRLLLKFDDGDTLGSVTETSMLDAQEGRYQEVSQAGGIENRHQTSDGERVRKSDKAAGRARDHDIYSVCRKERRDTSLVVNSNQNEVGPEVLARQEPGFCE